LLSSASDPGVVHANLIVMLNVCMTKVHPATLALLVQTFASCSKRIKNPAVRCLS